MPFYFFSSIGLSPNHWTVFYGESLKKCKQKTKQNKVQRFPYMLHNAAFSAANEQLAQEMKLNSVLATSLSTYNTAVRSKC